jgi:hypothetical protein
MQVTPRSESDLRKLATSNLLKAAWYDAEIQAAAEGVSSNRNDMIELTVSVPDGSGAGRGLRDWLTDVGRGAIKLRRACEAIGALDRYEAGNINASDFTGKAVRVKLGIQKKRGYPDRQIVEDYAPRQQSD